MKLTDDTRQVPALTSLLASNASRQCDFPMASSLTSSKPASHTLVAETPTADRDRLYQPLSSWQTRLIKLLPGTTDEPLRCELHVAAVIIEEGLGVVGEPSAVQYDALSYSWGRPSLTASIECNGMETWIPPSMADGLRQLRLQIEPRWMWCDALCINQSDNDEKSAQVRQMLLIFAKARKVVAWLGPAPTGAKTLADTVLLLHGSKSLSTDNMDRQLMYLREKTATSHEILKQLLEVPWFSRTWVRQEVFAAQALDLQIGPHSIPFESFIRFVKTSVIPMTPQMESLASTYGKNDDAASPSFRTTSAGFDDITSRTFYILSDNVHFDVSDQRDRVYALIGMIDELANLNLAGARSGRPVGQLFPVDYGSSVSTAYQNVIKFLINKDQNLSSLEVLGERRLLEDLPSWAIDWGSQGVTCRKWAYSMPQLFADFLPRFNSRTDGPSCILPKDSLKPPTQDLGAHNELRLKGSRLGVIQDSQSDGFIPHPWRFESEIEAIWGGKLAEIAYLDRHHEASRATLTGMLESGSLTIKSVGMGRDYQFPYQQPYKHRPFQGRLSGIVVSREARPGDVVVQLFGSNLIHVLRPMDGGHKFSLVSAGWFWRVTNPREKYTAIQDPRHPEMIFYGDIRGFSRSLAWLEAHWKTQRLSTLSAPFQEFETRVRSLAPRLFGYSSHLSTGQGEEFILM